MWRNTFSILLLVMLAGFLASAVPLADMSVSWCPACPRWLSVLLSLTLSCVCAVSLTYINRKMFTVSSSVESMPVLYLLMVTVMPSSLSFSQFHIVALLFPWAVYQIVRYISYERPKPSYYFYGVLLVSCASVILPSIVWLLPLMMSAVMMMNIDRGFKVILMTVGGWVLPYVYVMSYLFFSGGADYSGYWALWWSDAAEVDVSFANASLPGLFFMTSMAAVVSAASVTVFRGYEMASGSVKRTMRFSLLVTVSLFVLRILFSRAWEAISAPLTMIPVSFILLNYMECRRNRISTTLLSVLMISAAVYRVSLFL